MRVLVTGALGFIGHHLSIALAERGYNVLGVDNLSRGLRERIPLLESHGVGVEVADVRDEARMLELMKSFKPDAVVHLAALINVEESFEKPRLYEDVNAGGTITVTVAAVRAGAERLVYASSAAVYGNPRRLPIDEEHPLNPLSPYGVSKLAGEHYVRTLFNGPRGYLVLRLFNVYGPGQNPEYAGVIARFAERLAKGLPPVIYGDGEQTRDFIHVEDVVEAFIRSLEVPDPLNTVINIGTGRPVTVNRLARIMIELSGVETTPTYAPPRRGDIRHSYADISKAKRLLKWSPRIPLEEGLKTVITPLR